MEEFKLTHLRQQFKSMCEKVREHGELLITHKRKDKEDFVMLRRDVYEKMKFQTSHKDNGLNSLRSLREKRGLSSSDLAARLCVAESYIRRIEQNIEPPSSHVATCSAKILDTKISKLFPGFITDVPTFEQHSRNPILHPSEIK